MNWIVFFFFYKVLMNNFQGFSTNISPCCLSLSFASTNQRAVAIRDGASHCVAKQLVNNFYNRLMTEGDTHSTEGFIRTSHTHTHTACSVLELHVLFLPSCRSWWTERALPKRCTPSPLPHPFSTNEGKKKPLTKTRAFVWGKGCCCLFVFFKSKIIFKYNIDNVRLSWER